MNYGQNITLLYANEKKELLVSSSKDDDDIIGTTLDFLRKG